MPPKSQVTAQGSAPVGVSIDLDPISTAVATAASTFGSWVQSKLQTRAQLYAGSIKACASDVGQLTTRGQVVEDAMRNAVNTGTDCTSLVQKVAADLRENPAPVEATDDALRLAGRFSANLKRDLYVYEAIRIVARFR